MGRSPLRTTLLIDGDIILYRAAAVNQMAIAWDEGDTKEVYEGDLDSAIRDVRNTIGSLLVRLNASDLIICLSHKENWRYSVYPKYKSNRANFQRPALLDRLREWVREYYICETMTNLEADDVMGILATHPELVYGDKIVVSHDKDLRQIPGWLYNPDTDDLPWEITKEMGYWFHMFQTLAGDVADGYPGCPRVGKKTAIKLLKDVDPSEYWSIVVDSYEKKGLTEEDALVQARVSRICQHEDYNLWSHKVNLWSPNNARN
jgi:DNA polymerase-1